MLVFSIIGTLIGAGFASGQEMYLFFFRYGVNGILGLVLCSSLMAGVIYKTFIKEKKKGKIVKNKNKNKNKKIKDKKHIINIIIQE